MFLERKTNKQARCSPPTGRHNIEDALTDFFGLRTEQAALPEHAARVESSQLRHLVFGEEPSERGTQVERKANHAACGADHVALPVRHLREKLGARHKEGRAQLQRNCETIFTLLVSTCAPFVIHN